MRNIFIWIFLRLVPALIMIQTLFYKFSGAEESVYIFTAIGMEPWGRIGIGIGELIAGILLLIPKWSWLGALLGASLMIGAILFHIAFLGIEVQNDGGNLFTLAVIVFSFCIINLITEKQRIFSLMNLLKN